MADFDTDLFVIGGGSGGVRAARIAAGYGAKVMSAEEYRVGGTCVIRGCVPKKLLVYASRYSHDFEEAAGFGWTVPEPSFDWPTLIANKDREISRLEAAYAANLEKAGVEIVKSRAVLDDAHNVRLVSTGAHVRAEQILIATGGGPSYGRHIPGIEHVISSNEALQLPELPGRIVIQGGGYIAVDRFSRTSVPHIHAVGDVTNRVNLTPVAIREGHAFADTVFGNKPTAVDHVNVASAVFSEPEVGVIGCTETMARARFAKVDIYRTDFRPLRATLSGRATRVLMKLVVDGETDRVVGAHIVA